MRLSLRKLASAVRYNQGHMHDIGWADRWGAVAVHIGQPSPYTPAMFAQSLADWQEGQRGLTVDGKLGPQSWAMMAPLLGGGTAPPPAVTPATAPIAAPSGVGTGPGWMRIGQAEKARWVAAMAEMTDAQRSNAEAETDMDEEYFAASPFWGARLNPPGTPRRANGDWCAAFANFCLHSAGYSHTGSAGAHSFSLRRLWHFDGLAEPRVGCVIVLGDTTGSHVGFLDDIVGLPAVRNGRAVSFTALPAAGIKLFGGNQSQMVCSKRFKGRNLLAGVGRNGVTSPYMWPLQGPGTCNLSLPTAAAHHCGHPHQAGA